MFKASFVHTEYDDGVEDTDTDILSFFSLQEALDSHQTNKSSWKTEYDHYSFTVFGPLDQDPVYSHSWTRKNTFH